MSNKTEGSPLVRAPHDLPRPADLQHDLPDLWCFGLAHPYIQRLIFLAGALEQGTMNLDQSDCPHKRPSGSRG